MHETLQLPIVAGVILIGVSVLTEHCSRRDDVDANFTPSRFIAGIGMAAASGTWALLVVAGVGVIAARFPWLYAIIRIAGPIYLIWLGARMVLGARKPLQD